MYFNEKTSVCKTATIVVYQLFYKSSIPRLRNLKHRRNLKRNPTTVVYQLF